MSNKDQRECENPQCSAKFIPYSSRQRVCKKKTCRLWLMEQAYQKQQYKFTDEFIVSFLLNVNVSRLNADVIEKALKSIIFTNDDREKVEDGS